MKIAILDDYHRLALRLADWKSLEPRATAEAFPKNIGDIGKAAALLAGFDIICIMRERQAFPRALIEKLPRLKCLVTTGSGNAAIDLTAAREYGVLVCATTNGPGQRATAELTWALILAAARNVAHEERRLREGRWQDRLGGMLDGKTLGILGLGVTGSMVAGYGRAFGMKIVAWSQNLTPEHAREHGAELVQKADLFRRSDVVTLHVRLSDRTRHLVGAHELALMQPQALLVNTSRGPVVDEAALIAALEQGRIGGAALDVFDREPLPGDHVLRRIDNVVLSPHNGYVVREVYELFYRELFEAVKAFLEGKPIRVIGAV